MKSLEARKADRKRRAAENRKDAEEQGVAQPKQETAFDASEFLSGNVGDITNGIADLSDEQFAEVEAAGDKREGVKSAIAADRKRRESRGGTNWTPNL